VGPLNQRGHASVELALGVALLILPVALVVMAFAPWSERRVLAEAASAEAARAAVLRLDHSVGADVVAAMVAGHGLAGDQVRLGWCGGTPGPLSSPGGGCSLGRGTVVAATVQVWVPLVMTPWGGIGGLWVTGEHAEPVDLYRSLP